MGWDFEEKFGKMFKMSFHEIFDECGLNILKEQHYFRRKMRPDDNEYAEEACRLGLDLWLGGNFYLLGKK